MLSRAFIGLRRLCLAVDGLGDVCVGFLFALLVDLRKGRCIVGLLVVRACVNASWLSWDF